MTRSTSIPAVQSALEDGTFGAWVFRCNPRFYDLGPDIETGRLGGSWSMPNGSNYRLALMAEGQDVLLSVGGGSELTSGVWGRGRLTGEVFREVLIPGRSWTDRDRARTRESWAPLDLKFWSHPVERDRLKQDPTTSHSEFVRAPQVTPSFVTLEELTAIESLRGADTVLPVSTADGRKPSAQRSAATSTSRSSLSDAPTGHPRSQVEKAAIRTVISHFADQGYSVVDRQHERRIGFDLEFTKPGESSLHVEVKGRGSQSSTVVLTYSEMLAAVNDPQWRLALVPLALSTSAVVTVYRGDQLLREILPKQRGIDAARASR